MTDKPFYASKATIKRLAKAVEAAGMALGGIEARPDGSVVMLDREAIKGTELDDTEGFTFESGKNHDEAA